MRLPRGTDKSDRLLFVDEQDKLMNTVADTLFLMRRGYPFESALRFTASHYQCTARQILMLKRGICTDESLNIKKDRELPFDKLEGKTLYIDGFNQIITLEVLLSKGTIFRGRDNCIRDLAGLRGNYSIIDETKKAIEIIIEFCNNSGVCSVIIYLDSPVSNSGKLKNLIMEQRSNFERPILVELLHNPDVSLYNKSVVVSSDSIILEHCGHWFNLGDYILKELQEKVTIDFSIESNS